MDLTLQQSQFSYKSLFSFTSANGLSGTGTDDLNTVTDGDGIDMGLTIGKHGIGWKYYANALINDTPAIPLAGSANLSFGSDGNFFYKDSSNVNHILATQGYVSGFLPLAGATYITTSGNGLALTTSTLTSGALVDLRSTGTAAAGNTQTVFKISTSGANGSSNQLTYGQFTTNTHTGSGATNIAGYFSASGGATNVAIWTASGDIYLNAGTWIYSSVNNNITHSAGSIGADLSYTLRNTDTSGSGSIYALGKVGANIVGFSATTYGSTWNQVGTLDIASSVQLSTGLTTNMWVGAHDLSIWTGAAGTEVKSFYVNSKGFGSLTNAAGFYFLKDSGLSFLSLEDDSTDSQFNQGSALTTAFIESNVYGEGNNYFQTNIYNSAYVTTAFRNTIRTNIGTTYTINLEHTTSYSIQHNSVTKFLLDTSANLTLASLAGSGSRMVVASAAGLLSTATIPTSSQWTTDANGITFSTDIGIGVASSAIAKLSIVGNANNKIYDYSPTTGTSYLFGTTRNTGTILNTFIESSVGGTFISGTTAYSAGIYTDTASDLFFGTNGALKMIMTSGGNVGIGNLAPTASSFFELKSTTGALLITRLTTTQKNALTPINGMIVYDSTLDKFQGYEAGAWVSFI